MNKKITNTTKRVQENPIIAFIEYGMDPDGITKSERRGQNELLASTVLPISLVGKQEAFEALGFTFGPQIESDPLFREATLPNGWKREGSDHDMWSYIVDERGIRRVGVFYKAAFYDRRADMHIENVGNAIATSALYGDDIPTAESLKLSILTPDEIGNLRSRMLEMKENIKENPDIYGKYRKNLAAVMKLITEHVK
jgi:hypothetical protein